MSPSPFRSHAWQRGSVALLCLLCCAVGVWSSRVVAPKSVTAVLGKNMTLECRLEEVEEDLTITQTSWEYQLTPSYKITVAVYHPLYGIAIPPEFEKRLYFFSPTPHDATVVLENVGLADAGIYTCKVDTFPLGNIRAPIKVIVLAEPKVYVAAGSSALIDGAEETVVATCIAEGALPPAQVSWESKVLGHSEVQLFDEVNGTTSTQVSYLWQPTRLAQGHSLTCVVHHPALESELRIDYQLNVQFAPEISVVGYDGDWYVGRENVQMTCRANANPPAHHFRWLRLDSEMPEGVELMNNTLLFLRPLQRTDSGVYRCEVANDISLRSREVRIRIQDPPTMPSTTLPSTSTAPVLTGPAPPISVDDEDHVLLMSPTAEALPESNHDAIVKGVMGVAVFMVLVLLIVIFVHCIKRWTLQWNYYTRKCLGPDDQEKAAMQYQLQPTKAGSCSCNRDHDREEWGDGQLKHERDCRHHRNHNGEEYPPNGYTRAVRESSHHSPQQAHQREHALSTHLPTLEVNHSPYLSGDCYDNGPGGDYVSHKDGSVISRREFYV